jgi:hypothetical protein
VALFLSFRLFSLIMLQYGGIFGGSSDFDYYFALGQLSDRGNYPFLNFWSEYPPLFPWLAVGIYRLAALVGSGPPPISFFEPLLRAALLPFEVGNLLLVYQLARTLRDRTWATRAAWTYTALFAPQFVWLGWFEPLPVFTTLVALSWLLNGRPGRAGAACGLGIVAKLLPGLVAVVALRHAVGWPPERKRLLTYVRFLAPCAAVTALCCAPVAAANPNVFAVSVRSWLGRPAWESGFALLNGYYGFGFVPSLVARASWPTYVPTLPVSVSSFATMGAMLGTLLFVYVLPWPRPSDISLVAMTGMLAGAFLLVSSGFSPQFTDLVVPFAVILLPPKRAVFYVSCLTGVVLLGERYLYFWLFPPTAAILLGIVALRSALFVALAAEFWTAASPQYHRALAQGRRIGGVLVGMLVLGLVFGAGKAYASGGWGTAVLDDPARVAASQLHAITDPTDAIVTFDAAQYERLGPWLGDRAVYYLGPADLTPQDRADASLRELAAGHASIVTIDRGATTPLEALGAAWLRQYGSPGTTTVLKTGEVARQYILAAGLNDTATPPGQDEVAALLPGLVLRGFSVERPTTYQPFYWPRVTLWWNVLSPIPSGTTLSYRLIDSGGYTVAVGSDDLSPDALQHWPIGQVVLDHLVFAVDQPDLKGPLYVSVEGRVADRAGGKLRVGPINLDD